jgi:lipopolysaccharide export system protein LptA
MTHPLFAMNRPLFILFAGLLGTTAPLTAQQNATSQIEEAGDNLLSDPRLRNVLRNVKQDPGAALERVTKDPEEAVREATRLFRANSDGVDADEIKAAAAKMQSDGTLEEVKAEATSLIEKETGKPIESTVEEAKRAVSEAAASRDTVAPAATPMIEVPATRPAPGISGGAPTPVAMPLENGAPIIPDAPREAPALARPTAGGVPSAVAAANGAVMQETRVEPIAGASPTTPILPDLPQLGTNDVPAPMPLEKKYAKNPAGAFPAGKREHMEIRARESLMNNTKGELTFVGDVELDSPDYEMNCDKLVIYLEQGAVAEGATEVGGMKRAVASGGMVEIKRTVIEEGKKKTQIALGRLVDYDAVAGDVVLSGGPPYIQDGDRFVKTNSEDSKIIMRRNGLYEITGSTNRMQISIPIENKGEGGGEKGKAKGNNKTDSPFNNGLGDAFNGLR